MHTWKKVVVVLLVNSLTMDAIKGNENLEARVCKGEMVRRAKIQPMDPDHEHGAEGSERFYNPFQEKCLTKVDEPCPEVNATCAPNSECYLSQSSIMQYRRCYCNEGTIANIEKTFCGTRAGFGEDCSEVPPYVSCDPNERLSCQNNKCACQEPAVMDYDVKAKTCKTLAKGKCENDDHCVEDGYCRFDGNEWKCVCRHGSTYDLHCYRGLRQQCSAEKPCNNYKFLRCTDGFCKCKEPLQQLHEHNECAVLVGEKCQRNTRQTFAHPECVGNASCDDFVCKCVDGYSATLDRVCSLSLKNQGEACNKPGECDFDRGLACIDGICQCLDSVLTYDLVTKSCRAAVGMKCGLVERVGNRNCEYNRNDCPYYYISCERELPCLQKATTGESFCHDKL